MRVSKSLHSHWGRVLINFKPIFFIFHHPILGFMPNFCSLSLNFKFVSFSQALFVMNQIPRDHKNIRINTPCLANEKKLDK